MISVKIAIANKKTNDSNQQEPENTLEQQKEIVFVVVNMLSKPNRSLSLVTHSLRHSLTPLDET